jgi:hypothetical protein
MRSIDYMAIGQDEAIGSEDETGSGSSGALALATLASHIDMHDRGADRLGRTGDGFRIGVEQLGFGWLSRGGFAEARSDTIIEDTTKFWSH